MNATANEALDHLMMQWKKLASWKKPTHSIVALVFVNLLCGYLKLTDATTLNLALWTTLIAYVIGYFWHDVRNYLEYDKKSTTTEEEEGEEISTSEVSFMIEETKSYYAILKKFRTDSAGLFCLLTSISFLMLCYIGPYFSLLPCLYLILMGSLVFPLLLKQLKEEYPWILDTLGRARNMLFVILQDLLEKAKVKMEEWGKLALKLAEEHLTNAKKSASKYMPHKKAAEDHNNNPKEDELSVIQDVNGTTN